MGYPANGIALEARRRQMQRETAILRRALVAGATNSEKNNTRTRR